MKRNATRTQRQNYIAYAFDHLSPKNQTRLEDFTAELAQNHAIVPSNTVKRKKKKSN